MNIDVGSRSCEGHIEHTSVFFGYLFVGLTRMTSRNPVLIMNVEKEDVGPFEALCPVDGPYCHSVFVLLFVLSLAC